jgi:putative oxidoreductase
MHTSIAQPGTLVVQGFAGLYQDLLLLLARLFPAAIFLQSGRTKITDWQLNDSAIYLFQKEYRLTLLAPETAAWLAAGAEHVFALLLIVGLATRFSALALLAMTVVIQTWVYPDAWPTHGTWALAFLLLLRDGAGRFALDDLILRYRRRDQDGCDITLCHLQRSP